MSIISLLNTQESSSLKILGDIKDVLEGTVTEASLLEIDLSRIPFALGAGTFFDETKIGETLVLNSEGFVCYVDEDLKTKRGAKGLKSPFLLTLEENSRPSQIMYVDGEAPLTLEKLYEKLSGDFLAFALVGSVHFATLEATYLKKPPIFHESINENAFKYWSETEKIQDGFGYIFGVVVTEKGKQIFPEALLGRAFYKNPKQASSQGVMSHSHGALLQGRIDLDEQKKDPRFPSSLKKEQITGVRHLLTQSLVKEGLFALYDIKAIK